MGKINIVDKGLKWKTKLAPKIKLHEIAHPVDKTTVGVLENFYVSNLLNMPLEQLVSVQFGQILATGIKVDEKNFPVIYDNLKRTTQLLGIKIPCTIITNSIPGVNAFATGTDENPYIVISNVTPNVMNPAELTFIISHECGHVAMEHMAYHTAGSLGAKLSEYIPVLGGILSTAASLPLSYWNRCSEITADRIGLICCGDLRTAQLALIKIVSGFTEINEKEFDVEHYINQSKKTYDDHIAGNLVEFSDSHPIIFKRLQALKLFANSQIYFQVTNKKPPQGQHLYSTPELNKKIDSLISIL